MTTPGARYFRPRSAIALATLIAAFAASDRAEAKCDPEAPVNDTTVTCKGTTTDQNAPNGYGTGVETGITVNVQPGASVTGTEIGIAFTSGTVNNSGTIQATGTDGSAIFATDTATVSNLRSGTISANGEGGIAKMEIGRASCRERV